MAINPSNNGIGNATLLRLNTDGTTDRSISINQLANNGLGFGFQGVSALNFDSLGRVLIAGFVQPSGSSSRFSLTRYSADLNTREFSATADFSLPGQTVFSSARAVSVATSTVGDSSQGGSLVASSSAGSVDWRRGG